MLNVLAGSARERGPRGAPTGVKKELLKRVTRPRNVQAGYLRDKLRASFLDQLLTVILLL